MSQSVKDVLLPQLKAHEGLRLKPYRCTEGKLTIGVGRNLEDRGITEDEALYLLANDVDDVLKRLQEVSVFNQLDTARQAVLANMAFQLGFSGLSKFRRMWAALETEHYDQAAMEMMNSRWAVQTPNRAYQLSVMMREGNDAKQSE
ncbi:glycoside hydrolase family protein [Oceanospirillum maris]|uniref:glycoside hydrolase family protein n=1 Tax=Oceanospirillum maris TaxID=64977 RepID=UPI00056337C7|nr:glycoside hydrolase family protein [Oceanospirillum maris]